MSKELEALKKQLKRWVKTLPITNKENKPIEVKLYFTGGRDIL